MFFSHISLSPAFYLDPGSGSILFQMIVAAILGAGILIRSQWSRIKRWFGVRSEVDENENNEDDGGN